METLIHMISASADRAVELYWVPLLVWTVMAAVALVLLAYVRTLHVDTHYRIRQALLFSLPGGLSAAWLLERFAAAGFSGVHETAYKLLVLPGPEFATAVTVAESSGMTIPAAIRAIVFSFVILTSALLLIRLAGSYIRLRRMSSHLELESVGSITGIEKENLRRAGEAGRPIRIAFVEHSAVPVTFGSARPVVLLPHDLADDPVKLNMVLAHELIHIRNGDYRIQTVALAVRALFWYHPLCHLIGRQLEEYRELRCDSALLSESDVSKRDYAALLLELGATGSLSGKTVLALSCRSSVLQRRVESIGGSDRNGPGRGAATAALTLFFAFVLAISCTDIDRTERDVQPRESIEESDESVDGFYDSDLDAYVVVEEMPRLIGGLSVLQQELRYPEQAREAGIEGRVYVRFVVNEEGRVVEPSVIRGIGGGCDEEALRVVRQAQFEPGKQRGRPVRVQYAIPIVFQLAPDR